MFNRSLSMCGKITGLSLIIILALCATSSCGSSKQLDRSKAAKMIETSPQFIPIYRMVVIHERDRRYIEPDVAPASAEGEAIAVDNFFNSSPYRGVLRELGLVDVKAKYSGRENGRNVFELTIILTDKGRQLWRDSGTDPNESSIPLARRKLIAVTGLVGGDGNKGSRATAEFEWQWQATLAGRAMMKGTPEYERLPDKIKQQFNDPGLTVFGVGAKRPLELSGTRKGVANFQLFDDGWRLEPLGFDNRPLNPVD